MPRTQPPETPATSARTSLAPVTFQLRPALPSDVPGLTEIYNDAVLNTAAIWNEETVDEENRLAWLRAHEAAGFPVIVAEGENGTVLGYATFGDHRAWDGYRHSVEHSVYVRSGQRGAGLGRALMEELIALARAAGKHLMVAAVEAHNTGSLRLHESLGFEYAGTLKQVGAKFGRWLDLSYLTLRLNDDPTPA